MSIRINKAIGYAMPHQTFLDHTLLKIDPNESLYEQIEDQLDRPEFHNIEYKPMSLRGMPQSRSLVSEGNGLMDIIKFIGGGDRYEHVMFFPNMEYARTWYRRDDIVDYTFARKDSTGSVLEDSFTYLPDGIYPYEQTRMDINGVSIDRPRNYNDAFAWENDPRLFPDIPKSMRFYLGHFGILGLEGIAKLRPMRASWWS